MINNIFDVHAHYDDKWFDEDRNELFLKMKEEGVSYIVNAAVDIDTIEKAKEYTEKYDYVYATAGFHPENLDNLPGDYISRLKEYLSLDKFVAIGEIGLDYHWNTNRELQPVVFEEQLRLSLELNMPVVVHDRDAHNDTMNLLKKYKPKGILHCFSGSVEMLREVLKIGMSISMGGTVTFKNARVPVEVAREVPLDRLLLETDAPYLSPIRGERNDSRNISLVAEKIAEIKNMGAQELIDICTENAKKIYGL